MFNNLEQKNTSSKKQTASTPPVDDIFAETDKVPQENTSHLQKTSGVNGNISAKKVGLAVGEELAEKNLENNNNKAWFKWALIGISIIIVILSAYLIYNKFFKAVDFNKIDSVQTPNTSQTDNNEAINQLENNQEKSSPASQSANKDLGTYVATSSGNFSEDSMNESQIPNIPGVNVPVATSTKASSSEVVNNNSSSSLIDSDLDGLSDSEEINIFHTNPNNPDSDEDNLSDYNEVNIYHTNPNNPDSDGDGYTDGQEVKGGYNPLGSGKLGTSSGETSK